MRFVEKNMRTEQWTGTKVGNEAEERNMEIYFFRLVVPSGQIQANSSGNQQARIHQYESATTVLDGILLQSDNVDFCGFRKRGSPHSPGENGLLRRYAHIWLVP